MNGKYQSLLSRTTFKSESIFTNFRQGPSLPNQKNNSNITNIKIDQLFLRLKWNWRRSGFVIDSFNCLLNTHWRLCNLNARTEQNVVKRRKFAESHLPHSWNKTKHHHDATWNNRLISMKLNYGYINKLVQVLEPVARGGGVCSKEARARS